jgi:hypothetical protein
MGRGKIEQQTPDLFSTDGIGSRSANVPSGGRLALPKDLPNSIKYLDDQELDRLLAAAIEEAKKRGRPTASFELGPTKTVVQPKRLHSISGPKGRQKIGPASRALTQGQINAVRAAFKAGITPARIARQFGLSHAEVRTALSADT